MRSPNAQNTASSKEAKVPHPIFPPFGLGLDMLSAAASKSVMQREFNKNAPQSRTSFHMSPPKNSNCSSNIFF